MILLVDDEPQLRKVFARRLRQEGYQVTEAADGAETLELLNAAAFNFIITDLRMPKVDGVNPPTNIWRSDSGCHRSMRLAVRRDYQRLFR